MDDKKDVMRVVKKLITDKGVSRIEIKCYNSPYYDEMSYSVTSERKEL